MNTEIRQRRIRLQEKKKAATLVAELDGFYCHEFHDDTFPAWITSARSHVSRMGASPETRLRANNEEPALRAWLEDFIASSGIGQRFYVKTDLKFFPWLDCEIRSTRYVDNLLALTADLWLISEATERLVCVFLEEYEDDFAFCGYIERRNPAC